MIKIENISATVDIENVTLQSLSFVLYHRVAHDFILRKIFKIETEEIVDHTLYLKDLHKSKIEDLEHKISDSEEIFADISPEATCNISYQNKKLYVSGSFENLLTLEKILLLNFPAFHIGDAAIYSKMPEERYPVSLLPKLSIIDFEISTSSELQQLLDTYVISNIISTPPGLPLTEQAMTDYAKGVLYQSFEELDNQPIDLEIDYNLIEEISKAFT